MIKTIIKRDGQKEPFSAEKINRWGEWAAKTLGKLVDWPSVVLHSVSVLPETCTSEELQKRLIKTCLEFDSWSYNRMAGRLYAALVHKDVFKGKTAPSIKELHTKLIKKGLMVDMGYSDEQYAEIERIIDHRKDFKAPYYELHQIQVKYSIKDRVKEITYETPQFAIIRMAMSLAQDRPESTQMHDLERWYYYFSNKILNAPTPNWVNLGTPLNGYASCAVYTVDDNSRSLAIGDHIAYTMTCMSAGIGSHLSVRSEGDPVRGGAIRHMGKLPYYRSLVAAGKANMQAGRGGAITTHYNAFDPEVETISKLKNPRSTEDKKIRGMDYSMGSNKFFARKAAKNEKIFTFNCYTAPDLYDALYSPDQELFEKLYTKYENNKAFKKNYVDARKLLINVLNEGYETGRAYLHWIDELNRHTPFKETIYSSNLCQEIALPTKPYQDMRDLYADELHDRGEIALCSLAAINVAAVKSDDEYAEACYYALLMIDVCIHKSEWPFPHLKHTAKARMNAGVGIIGLAHLMAKSKKKYSTEDGKQFIHKVAETHMWHLLNASLRLGKELGNAKWMHKTKWPDGWLPIDTYAKSVDEITDFEYYRDWEWLRKAIIANGGIRNSVVGAHMPSESSSLASATTNSGYPVRELTLIKTDNSKTTYWAAPEGDRLGYWYEFAWDIDSYDMIDVYSIIQKFTDQTISADLWRKIGKAEKITTTEMINIYLRMTKRGLKSRYYQNSKTSEGIELNSDGPACGSGGCTL